jgi:hypothetical protein
MEFSAEVIKRTRDDMGLTLYRLLEAVAHYQMVLSRLEAAGSDFCRESAEDLSAIDALSQDFLTRANRLRERSKVD